MNIVKLLMLTSTAFTGNLNMNVLVLGSFPHYRELMREIALMGVKIWYEPSKAYEGDFDLIYLVNKSTNLWSLLREASHVTKLKSKVMIGAHRSIFVKYHRHLPKGLVTRSYNLASLLIMTYYRLINVHIHSLNSFEYEICRKLGLRAYFAPLAVPVSKYCYNNVQKFDRFTVLFYAPRYQKGVDFLTYIVPKFLSAHSDAKFVVLGSGYQDQYVRQLLLRFPKNVSWVKRITSPTYERFLSKVSVYLNLSRYETFGVLILDSFAAGTPVIAFNIPGASQDIMWNYKLGFVVDPFDLDGIIKRLSLVYDLWKNRPEDYRDLCLRCRRVAEKFDVSRIAPIWVKMFEEASNDV